MNPYFSAQGPTEFVLPLSVYARLEGIEFPATKNAPAVMRFDAIDAAWLNDQRAPLFNLEDADISAAAWARLLAGASAAGALYPDPLQDAPISSLTIEVPYNLKDWCQQLMLPASVGRKPDPGPELIAALQQRWYFLELKNAAQHGASNARLYRWILDEGIQVFAAAMPLPVSIVALSAMTSLAGLPTLTSARLAKIMHRVRADYLAVYDVGQANANALLKQMHDGISHAAVLPSVYYDLGIPTKAHHFTQPTDLKFCFTLGPPIVLSHWHEDHFAGIALPSYMVSPQQCAWIVPDHKASFKHAAMVTGILAAGGSITVIPAVPPDIVYTCPVGPMRTMYLSRGKTKDPNGSGIVMAVTNDDPKHKKEGKNPLWLLTGDCGLRHFNNNLKALIAPKRSHRIQALVAPHHGGYMPKTAKAIPAAGGYQRLIYSFGRNNTYKHATNKFVTLHHAAGWNHPLAAGTPTVGTASLDILATNINLPGAAAPGGATVSWSTPCPSISALCNGAHCNAPLTKK